MLTKTNNSDLICILTWVVWDNEDAVIKNIKRHGMMRQSILCKKYALFHSVKKDYDRSVSVLATATISTPHSYYLLPSSFGKQSQPGRCSNC
jgi:hypothetical protein